jgi:hypothetical protein
VNASTHTSKQRDAQQREVAAEQYTYNLYEADSIHRTTYTAAVFDHAHLCAVFACARFAFMILSLLRSYGAVTLTFQTDHLADPYSCEKSVTFRCLTPTLCAACFFLQSAVCCCYP